MKLLHDLPETVRRRLETAGFPETPLYTLPAVLEGDGEGWCVVTTTALHVADPDLIHRTVRHADLEEVKARKGTGAGWLEARVAGSWILLATACTDGRDQYPMSCPDPGEDAWWVFDLSR